MIYFIQAEEGGPIKIGTTVRLTERLKALCKETASNLRVLAVVDGGLAEEQSLHSRFSHLRVVNEWFEPGDDLVGFLVEEGRPWDGADEKRTRPLVVIKGYEAWGEWLEGLAARKGMPVTVLIDQALREVAKREGYPDPPARY